MKKIFTIIVHSLGWIISAHAQVSVSGYIRTVDSIPVKNASILLHELSKPDKPLVNFTTSDNKGFYSLKIEDTQSTYLLTVKAPSFKTVEKKLDVSIGYSSFQPDFVLSPSISYLDTVKVDIKMSISQTGDTITFNPNAFTLKNETTVEDLLSRLPGMEIKEDGKIYFNGKLVNGVLIDGDDLFKKNYQLLTQNAASKIIDKVQVFKNYQKDQLLKEFNQPGNQVINLKIKDQYKNYLFGNGTLGYGNNGDKLADLFLIRLSPQTKIQAGGNYNTTGSTYTSENKFNAEDFGQNENSFFSYQPATSLLDLYRYYFRNIPGYYQDRNQSVQGYTNALFKRNKWENVLNARFATDKLRNDQQLRSIYNDGTVLFTNNTGFLRNRLQDYNYTASKNLKKESVYINAALQNKQRDYGLQTASNQSLESNQQLTGNDLTWQLNFSYNKKLKEGLLWSSTFGYFHQTNKEALQTNPDFLFWLFPDDLSLNMLKSDAAMKLSYLNFKSSLLFNSRRITNEIGMTFSNENRAFRSNLQSKNLADDSTKIPFQNNSSLRNPFLAIQYKGRLRLSLKKGITLNLSNEPHFLSYRLISDPTEETTFFYDYSIGLSSRQKSSTWGLNVGVKRKPADYDLFFPDFVQTGFHSLQSGRMDTYGGKSIYLQASYNLFSIKMGWIAFFLLNISHDKNDFIRNLETKGIATINSFSYYPNSTNQVFFIFNSQKTLGEWPLSLNSNIIYNRQSRFDGFNNAINKSDFQFLNGTLGFKSLFKSFINFDYNFSLLYSDNKIKSPVSFSNSTYTVLNKLNLYVTPQKVFNSTITLNNIISNRGAFKGYFLDVTFNRKFLNKKLITELNLRNIFDKDFIDNTTITPYYKQENRIEIRGAELFITVRYEIR